MVQGNKHIILIITTMMMIDEFNDADVYGYDKGDDDVEDETDDGDFDDDNDDDLKIVMD